MIVTLILVSVLIATLTGLLIACACFVAFGLNLVMQGALEPEDDPWSDT